MRDAGAGIGYMKNKSILIVDDEPHIGAVIAGKLRQAGARATTAHDGCEALRLCREHGYDLIIADLCMPRMDGAALVEALARDAATADVPVLILTGLGHTMEHSRLARSNVAGIMAKPFSPRDLVERVRHALAGTPTGVKPPSKSGVGREAVPRRSVA